jgi:hypothetical protein
MQDELNPRNINGVPMLNMSQSARYVGMSRDGFVKLLARPSYSWVKRVRVGEGPGAPRYIPVEILDKIKARRLQIEEE